MDFYANEGKAVTIQANGKTYARHAITTHFVQVGENYIDLLERYVIPVYQPGDILSASEKVIALCQGRVVTEEQVKPGFWAKLLSRFVHQTAAGPGMGLPVKMQFAINFCGLGKVLNDKCKNKCAPKHHYPLVAFVTPPGFLAECFFHRYAPFLKCKINHAPDSYHCTEQERGKFEYSVVCFLRKT